MRWWPYPPAAVVVVDWWHFHPPMDRKLHQFPPQQPYSTCRKIRPVSSLPPTARNDVGSYPAELFFKTRIQTFLPPVECILHIAREESDKRIAQGILFRISLDFLQPHQQTSLLLLLLLYCVWGFFHSRQLSFSVWNKKPKLPHHVSIFIELLHDTLEAEWMRRAGGLLVKSFDKSKAQDYIPENTIATASWPRVLCWNGLHLF